MTRWPNYIPRHQADVVALRYPWDDLIGDDIFVGLKDDKLLADQRLISDRANLALAAACVEWLVHRYSRVSDNPVHFDLIEAMWAAGVDSRYMRPWDPIQEEWSGPVRGPLLFAMLYGQHAVRELATQAGPGGAVLYLSGLATIVLPEPSAFIDWRNAALARLAQLYPFDPEDTPGDVVPRQMFESANFDPHSTESLVQSFLARLDPSSNELLHDPQEMRALSFEREPYTFELAHDREIRNIW